MARCGCSEGTCNCTIQAGTGATVTGNGTAGNPYIVSATGGTDCTAVRACISAADGATFTPATGVITARLSTDAGNTAAFGGDGGIYVPTPAVSCATVRACLSSGNGATYVPATGVITARLSTDAGNTAVFGGDGGIYVPAAVVSCATVRACLSSGNGATYVPATGVITARLSTDAGNTAVFGGDGGIYVPAPSCATIRACLSSGNGATYVPATGVITARLSTDAGNTAVFGGDGGIYVPAAAVSCATVRACLSSGNGATYVPATGVITARLSTDAGNTAVFGGDGGIYVPAPSCATIRACISSGNGATFVPATGVITARLSTDAGNTAAFGGDGGIYVPPSSVVTGCGLTGNGLAATPIVAKTATWPYACNLEANASQVYCDNTGTLRAEPRGTVNFVQQFNTTTYANLAVPAGTGTTILTDNLNIPNTDPCRTATAIIEVEVDVDITLPPNNGALYAIAADDMVRFENKGTTTANDQHWQMTKVFSATVPPASVVVDPLVVRLGGNFGGGATYSRIQTTHRAWIFNL